MQRGAWSSEGVRHSVRHVVGEGGPTPTVAGVWGFGTWAAVCGRLVGRLAWAWPESAIPFFIY
jgi:hypothetical protein